MIAFERREISFPWSWHYHPEIELTLILEGRGIRVVGDHSEDYRPYDLVLLGANLPHTWSSTDSGRPTRKRNRAIVVQFQPRMFPEFLLALPEFGGVGRLLSRAGCGLRFSRPSAIDIEEKMRMLLRIRGGLEQWLALARILGQLARESPDILASEGYRHRRSYKLSSRIERVTSHIEKHYGEEMSVDQVARIAGMTPSAFSRFFRKMTHRTFVDYRNGCRVREACRLLAETDLSITDIAYRCGFGNLANFNRRFLREKLMPPRDYRKLRNP